MKRFANKYTITLAALLACSCEQQQKAAPAPSSSAPAPAAPVRSTSTGSDPSRQPNELGRIPILEYHLIGDSAARWMRERGQFRKDLEMLYERGYRPVSVAEVLDKKIDLPAGLSPVVFTFDDASPSQFSYIEQNGQLVIDPKSGLGIWQDFAKQHPDWRNKAVFCLLSGAQAGHAFFGDKGIDGQKTEWRHRKVKYLADQGFELCNHTLWHAQLSKYPDAFVQQQIAQLALAVDSAVPGYKIRTLALPQGLWPKNRELSHTGSWTDPKSGKTIRYDYGAVLEVSGPPARSPYDPQFDGHKLPRVQVTDDELKKTLDSLDKTGTRYVSDGNPNAVARKPATAANDSSAHKKSQP